MDKKKIEWIKPEYRNGFGITREKNLVASIEQLQQTVETLRMELRRKANKPPGRMR